MELPKIQIVEDERLVADELYESIRALGYRPLAPDSTLAGAVVACERERPDLVLVDIGLAEGGDGIELVRLLKQKREMAIVYLTSSCDRETIHRASQTRPDGYLIKPVGRDSLFATLEIALHRELAAARENDQPGNAPLSRRVKRAIAFMEDHITENISTGQLAEMAGISRDHFVRVFRESTRETPHHFLVRRRIARACRILETTDLRITEVARQCGYESLTYFTTLFRKKVGVSPAAYRRSHR
ncbi:MAG: DNA-binding response regulator [Myxococcota bacterium]